MQRISGIISRLLSYRASGRIGFSRLVPLFIAMTAGNCHAQTAGKKPPKYLVGLGEYQCFIISTATGNLYGISTNPRLLGAGEREVTPGLPTPVAIPEKLTIRAVASGLHSSLAVDNNGEVWTWGSNENGQAGNGTTENIPDNYPHKIKTDSLGRPFTNVVQVACWGSSTAEGCLAVKADGSLWIWGNTTGGFRGNGQYGQVNTLPVEVMIPGKRKIVKVIAAEIVLALASDGTVWSWGGAERHILLGRTAGDFSVPGQVILPQKAKDIAGASYLSYALGNDGKLYGWGYAGAYLGIGNGGYKENVQVPLPRDLSKDLNLPHPVVSVVTNSVSTHVILSDSTLWGWGDNAMGCVGNGEELDFARHIPPYATDFGPSSLIVQKPVRLADMVHNFTHIFGGSAYVFYSYAETATGQLYSWGRNKGAVLGNGIVGASSEIMATYPNSWDVPYVTAVDPFALQSGYLSTSPYCLLHPDGNPCNGYRRSSNIAPVANAGADREIPITHGATASVILDGKSSHDQDGKIAYHSWTKVSGPAGGKILSPGSSTTAVTGLTAGTYVFALKVTDNGWATDSATVRISIKGNPQP